ncbi:hypothetical protein L6R49_17700 [Myxococcota bacterium]|nr:hypothetical protein [Myxococcota bacterium]
MRAVLLSLALVFAACKPAPPEVAAAPELLPAPFDAAALQAGLPVGATFDYRMAATGAEPTFERWEVVAASDAELTIRTTALDPSGAPTGTPSDEPYTWPALESHARFPAAVTVIREDELITPMGTLPVKVYVVEPPGDEARADIFYFAPSMPGPPVRMETEVAGAVVFTMEMIRRTLPSVQK